MMTAVFIRGRRVSSNVVIVLRQFRARVAIEMGDAVIRIITGFKRALRTLAQIAAAQWLDSDRTKTADVRIGRGVTPDFVQFSLRERETAIRRAEIAQLAATWRLGALPAGVLSSCLLLAGCVTSSQTGPFRPYSIDQDVAAVQPYAEPVWPYYASLSAAQQAVYRNNILTARMYIADLEYHYYEARLTKEIQEEGLLATAANLGLTGSASLIPVAQTSRLLAGIATGVTGLDKAYNEKELLSNTMQALQTQMRADRKAWAAEIQAKMLKPDKATPTPITEYTLLMALSDADAYYQAGTIASALVGLSKTVATAENAATQAKANSGPNAQAVLQARAISTQTVPIIAPVARPTTIRDVNAPLQRFNPAPRPQGRMSIGPYEAKMQQKDMKRALDILGCAGTDLGPKDSSSRKALAKFLADNGKPSSDHLTVEVFTDLREIKADGKQGTCSF
jgi:hypothetical protein